MAAPPAAAEAEQLARCRHCNRQFNPRDVKGGFNNHVRNCAFNPKVKARKGVRKGRKTPPSSGVDRSDRSESSPLATPSAAEHSPRASASNTPQKATRTGPKRSFASFDTSTPHPPASHAVDTPARLTAASVLSSLSDENTAAAVATMPNARLCRRFTVLIFENEPEAKAEER